ncbi:class I SAM-dependent methyltransferase [Sporohalobacter salinus]|uniref:class I SAM-dependent methyltransferase n=1 Tax=Sporohalobacter salinus TaxID=1494606 RepID=UPI0019600495|nr:class I SAM-dependent methyltransferase [Sporohalobacter salinus]MBM7624406.1 2-polyprenyl-3-methyl-5-hydroxy-6-metoxy-1,4-benzoquinol methylase [Sporohalobacter salinus]
MGFKKRNEKYWDDGSEIYSELIEDELDSFKKDAWKELIRKNTEEDYKTVLDVGTGPGFFAIIMTEMGYEVTAVDSSEKMINQAKQNAYKAGVDVKFIKDDIKNMNFSKESFDIIISRNVTWTLKEPVEVYKNWHKLLKKDGKLIIFDANWNRRLIDPQIQKQYEKDLRLAKSMGYDIEISDELEEEGDDIALKLPLTYEFRPDWDEEILTDIGFKEILIEEFIDEFIYTEAEKIVNNTTPTFCISAKK